MARVSKNNSQRNQTESPPPVRRERRGAKGKPTPAEVAAEAASMYPDTFETPPTAEEIAAEAYAIYQSRGGQHGRHDEDWFEAERRVNERRLKPR